jgi:hypothetical protein
MIRRGSGQSARRERSGRQSPPSPSRLGSGRLRGRFGRIAGRGDESLPRRWRCNLMPLVCVFPEQRSGCVPSPAPRKVRPQGISVRGRDSPKNPPDPVGEFVGTGRGPERLRARSAAAGPGEGHSPGDARHERRPARRVPRPRGRAGARPRGAGPPPRDGDGAAGDPPGPQAFRRQPRHDRALSSADGGAS